MSLTQKFIRIPFTKFEKSPEEDRIHSEFLGELCKKCAFMDFQSPLKEEHYSQKLEECFSHYQY